MIDLFEHIKIAAMDDVDKIEQLKNGEDYVRLLSTDRSFQVRLRAKKILRVIDETIDKAYNKNVKLLQADAASHDFSTRIRAKAKLRKLEENA